ncbi:MAG: transglycosylase domain-containing protein [Candidatus Dormibacteria bacterium]
MALFQRSLRRATATRARRRLLIAAAMLVVVMSQLPLLLNAGLEWLASAVGEPTPRTMPADTIVVDRNGTEIADLHPPGATRLPVPLTAMSPAMQQAVVAVEDRHFWTEGAVDVQRLAAASLTNVNSGSAQGASTLPMQLVKILYLNDDRSFSFKVREIGLAQRLVNTTPKPQILGDYLNDAYFGEGATGVEAAAHVYFGIDAGKLDLAQSAMLAGLPNAPTTNDPLAHPGAGKTRMQTVLASMVSNGNITAAEAVKAQQEQLHFAQPGGDDIDLAPAFMQRVADEVQQTLHADPATAGLRITSTLDLARQQHAAETVAAQVGQLQSLHVTDGAALEMDPSTGEVLAYVGSAGSNVPGGAYDMASTPRQPGSSFKLFTYTTAIATSKASMVSQVLDGPMTVPGGAGAQSWSPLDYDRTWHGPQPLERALGNSLNVPAVRTELVTGIPAIVNTARQMGVTTLTAAPQSYGPSLTLGTYPVPLAEMAQAGGVVAAGGVMHAEHFVRSIAQPGGAAQPWSVAPARQVLDPRVAFIMNTMLSNDANRTMEFGAGSALTVSGHTVAAKTGTSEDFRDNVTLGWTPHLVTATWVGNADDSPMHGTTGITGAAPVFHELMARDLGSTSDDWPAAPPGLTAQSSQAGTAYFLPGTDANTGEPALMTLDAQQQQGAPGHGGHGPGKEGGPGKHH